MTILKKAAGISTSDTILSTAEQYMANYITVDASALPLRTTHFPSCTAHDKCYTETICNNQQLQTLLAWVLLIRLHFNFWVICGLGGGGGGVNIELI